MSKPSIPYRLLLSLNNHLYYLEHFIPSTLDIPPIFIVGPPRSGSTLFYQVMAASSNFSFLSNLHCRFFGAPWLVEKFSNYRKKYQGNSNFESSFGTTKSWYEPSECGNFWYRFFPRNPKYCSSENVPLKKIELLKKSIGVLQFESGRPFLSKNLMNTFRIKPIVENLPNALFIVIKRDILQNAHSLLEARFKINGNYNQWFSTEPEQINELKMLSPEAQVVEQIISSYKECNLLVENVPNRVIEIEYEQFCNNPTASLNQVKAFLASHSITFTVPNHLPTSFTLRNEIRIEASLYNRLQNYIESYYSKF